MILHLRDCLLVFLLLLLPVALGDAAGATPAAAGRLDQLRRAGRIAEARKLAKEIEKAAPQDAGTWAALASFYQKTNEFDDAVLALERAIALDRYPHQKDFHQLQLVKLLRRQGELNRAIEVARNLAENPRQNYLAKEARRLLTAMLREKKKPIEADIRGMHAVPAPGKVKIDGKLADWDFSGRMLSCDDVEKELDTFSAKLALMYDAENFYISIHFKDRAPLGNRIHPVREKGAGWQGDSVQLRIRASGWKVSSFDCWYYQPTGEAAVYYQPDMQVRRPIGGRGEKTYMGKGPELGDGLEMAFLIDADKQGYVQEIKIPWALISRQTLRAKDTIYVHFQLFWGKRTYQKHLPTNATADVVNKNGLWTRPSKYGSVYLEPKGKITLPVPRWRILLERRLMRRRRFNKHTDSIRSIAFTPDGKYLLSGSMDQTVRLWDPHSGAQVRVLKGHVDQVWAIAVAPDGRSVASAGQDRSIRLWEIATGKEIKRFTGHEKGIWGVAFAPDGKRLASASLDHTVRVWDVASGKELLRFKAARGLRAVAFSPDGRHIAGGGLDCMVYLWDLEDKKLLKRFAGHRFGVRSVRFSPDGKRVLSAADDMTIRLWDLETGKQFRVLKGHSSLVTCAEFIGDGKRVLSGALDGTIRLWDLANARSLYIREANERGVWSVAVAPDMMTMAAGGRDRIIWLLKMPQVAK